MLFDCRIAIDTRGANDFAFSIRQIFRWSFVTSYTSGNVLINSVLQSLGSSTHVPTVTAAHVLIYDHTLLKGGKNIFMDCRQNFSFFSFSFFSREKVSNSGNNICNLSAYVLSDTEKFVLSHGLDFC